PDMTDRAIEPDPIETEIVALRGSDRAIHSLFEDEAERLPSLPRQVVATERRQGLEDADRYAGETVAAGRAVFELVDRVVEEFIGLIARIVVGQVGEGDDDQQRDQGGGIPGDPPHWAMTISGAVSAHRSAPPYPLVGAVSRS